MRSALPKVLHPLCGLPMIGHVLRAAKGAGVERIVVVLGHAAETVESALPRDVTTVLQEPQWGTGHAVSTALAALPADGATLILSGDMPLLRPHTLQALYERHQRDGHPMSLVSAVAPDARGYGRILRDSAGRVVAVKEQKELTLDQEHIDEINCGLYCVDIAWLRRNLASLPRHGDGEYYLPDLVAVALDDGGIGVLDGADAAEMQGVNTRVQLAEAMTALRTRIAAEHMLGGVTIVDPAATYIDVDITIGADTIVLPQTYLTAATVIGQGCMIGPDSDIRGGTIHDNVVVARSQVLDATIESGARVLRSVVESKSHVGRDCIVGPFSHLRSRAILHQGAEVGNFAEVKNSTLGVNVANHHFGYLGDAVVGEETNIGAGTITCNYDGARKHRTSIGAHVFVGSGTLLRAPVVLGDGANTGAGSVVLQDVAPGQMVAGVPARPIISKRSASQPGGETTDQIPRPRSGHRGENEE